MRNAPLVAVGSACLIGCATATLYAYASWNAQPLASGGPGGFGVSNAAAVQPGTGQLFIAYSDTDKDDVLLRSWNGSAWQVQTVDAGRSVASGIDLAFNGDNPAVSYAGAALKYAERIGSKWTVQTVDSKNAANDVTSLKVLNGQPAISYYTANAKGGGSTLKLARRSGSNWSITSVAAGVRYSSLAFDAAGYPAIAFAGDTNGDTYADSLRLARQTASGWTIQTIDTSSGAGVWARLAFDPATGRPMVVDRPSVSGLVRFWYQDAGGSWHLEPVGTGISPALIVHDGVPLISYATLDAYAVILAERENGTWTEEFVAAAPFGYIRQSSLAVPAGTGGEPAIAYCIDIFGINASRTLWLAWPLGY